MYENGIDIRPKPVERITRETYIDMQRPIYNARDRDVFKKVVNELFDYIEYLEANQKE